MALANAAFEVLPRHDLTRNQVYAVATQVVAETSPGDLVLARSDDLVGLYLVYFGPRQVAVVVNGGRRLDAILAYVAQQADAPARVLLVDSRADRAEWWEGVLSRSDAWQQEGWSRQAVVWQPPGGLVVELLPRR